MHGFSHRHLVASLAFAGLLAAPGPAAAETVHARLQGFQEVPSVSSPGSGELRVKIIDQTLDYELSYEGLEGTPTQAHIHVAQPGVNGGISVWLCGNAQVGPPAINPPPGTPACPVPGGTASGTLGAGNVVGPAAQLFAAGEIAELIAAIRAGVAYANVHTNLVPGGEIRGQLK